MRKSIQRTVFNGIFKLENQPMGFSKGIKITYINGDKKVEMSPEQFAVSILDNMVFVKSVKQTAPKVKVMVKVDLSELEGYSEEDIGEYKEEAGEV